MENSFTKRGRSRQQIEDRELHRRWKLALKLMWEETGVETQVQEQKQET